MAKQIKGRRPPLVSTLVGFSWHPFLPKTLKMGQTSDPETLVVHQKLTPGYNPKTFKQD
jgi:hypothetical protein